MKESPKGEKCVSEWVRVKLWWNELICDYCRRRRRRRGRPLTTNWAALSAQQQTLLWLNPTSQCNCFCWRMIKRVVLVVVMVVALSNSVSVLMGNEIRCPGACSEWIIFWLNWCLFISIFKNVVLQRCW